MHRESNWRYYFILAVTALCLIFTFPTARYVHFVFTQPRPEDPEKAEAYDEEKGKLQREAIGLGLDLIGGVDVLLKVDVDQTRSRILNSQRDAMSPLLREKRIAATLALNPVRDRLILTVDDKANVRQAMNALSDYLDAERGIFDPVNEGRFVETGQAILKLQDRYLRNELTDQINQAVQTIRRRVDEFGVTQPSVSTQDSPDGLKAIRVQVPGERDPAYVISQIIKPAQLEFYVVHQDQFTPPPDVRYNPAFSARFYEEKTVPGPRGEERVEFVRTDEPLPPGHIGMVGEVTDYSATPPSKAKRIYIVKEQPEMTGEHLRDAFVKTGAGQLGIGMAVGLSFDRQGAAEFQRVTKEYLKRQVAIALDKMIYSAPTVQVVIPNGQAEITGNFTADEARELAQVLKAGAIPADLNPDEKRVVGPTLGQESITQSLKALALGAAVITAFMIVYYGTAGFISILALILNVLVIVACLNLFKATLTLSGIGGMILTLGMAVDANVLIYERIREEIRSGRPVMIAIRSGFGRAFSVIFDSNLTTLLAAGVLLQFGEGSVQGFALTMAFGLIANLFTGLTVTYALCSLYFRWRGKLSLGVLSIFQNTKIDFIWLRRVSFTLSGLLILLSVGGLVAKGGPQFAVDFSGGVLSEIRVLNSQEDESQNITRALPGDQAKVQRITSGPSNDYLVRLALQAPPESAAGESETEYTQAVVEKTLRERYGEGVEILGTTVVSQEVGQQFRNIALLVIIAASLCILAYLWFRFELVFGVAAVISMLHDLTIVLGIITLLNVQISLEIVSALLILLGFSVNDTIVIFDRIRENSHTMFGKPFKVICNTAMNRTLSRTLITSGTTVGMMLIMYLYGGHSLAPFALTLIVGGIVGTYSSDFVAAPLVYLWNERQKGRLVEHLGKKDFVPSETNIASVATAGAGAGAAGGSGVAGGGASPRQRDQRRGRR